MALGEGLVRKASKTPERYAAKVRALACIYAALNGLAFAAIAIVGLRIRFLVTLAQRSNVETLVLAIVVVLAAYYVASTAAGAVGAGRMLAYELPAIWGADERRIEQRKQRALRDDDEPLVVCFDHTVRLADDPETPIGWRLADAAGSLGEIVLEGAAATLRRHKKGVNGSVFEFLTEQINAALERRSARGRLDIVYWGNVDSEAAAVYRGTVASFDNLAHALGREPVWPSVTLTRADVEAVQNALGAVVSAVRSEALLPDVEYEVEYSVPILPEPLAFVQLKRQERRADPVLSMGYALIVMCAIVGLLVLAILFPPWVPSK